MKTMLRTSCGGRGKLRPSGIGRCNDDFTREYLTGADGLFLRSWDGVDARPVRPPVVRALRSAARTHDAVGGGNHPVPHLGDRRADGTGMIGFYRQDSGGRLDRIIVSDQVASACKSGDTDILEDEGAENEGLLVGEGIEVGTEPGLHAKHAEAGLEVDDRAVDLDQR